MRVNYDQQNWNALVQILLNNHLSIHVLNRVALVDDVFQLAYSNELSYDTGLNISQYLQNELDQMPWTSVDVHFRRLRDHFLYTSGYSDISSYIDQISLTIAQYLGLDESSSFTFTENLNRLDVLPMACDYDSSYCVSEAAAKIASWSASADPDDPANNPFGIRMRDAFYCAGVKGSATTEGWQFIKGQYESNLNATADDRQALVRAITCPYDQTVQQSVLDSLLSFGSNYYADIDEFIKIFGSQSNWEDFGVELAAKVIGMLMNWFRFAI